MVHDDDTTPPEHITIRSSANVGKGDSSQPSQEIYNLIVTQVRAHPLWGPRQIHEQLNETLDGNVRLDWIQYVLNDLAKSPKGPGRSF